MSWKIRAVAVVAGLCAAFSPGTLGGVVINEVMYHAPDDLEDLEYIELFNTGAEAVDLGGWKFTKGIKYQFPAGAKIAGNGFVVIARNPGRFREYYQFAPAGVFKEKLSNSGEHLILANVAGEKVDAMRYKDRAPWPLGADGQSGSLERICPTADGEEAGNWMSSPLDGLHQRPMGTPGAANAAFAKKLPPVVSNVRFSPSDPAPGQTVTVQCDVKHTGEVKDVVALYRLAGPGGEKAEVSVPMQKVSDTMYSAALPGQGKDSLVRFRIEAKDAEGAARFFPAATEPRPAFSYYVHEAIVGSKVPFAWIIDAYPKNRPQRAGNMIRRNPFQGGEGQKTPFQSAFVYYDPETKKTQLFDFVQFTPRKAGHKVHFYSDQPLDEMTAINLIFEYDERMLYTEPMAYEIYRMAGMPAEKSYHVRVWINGEPVGYQLLVEQPNKGFLRRNKIVDDGNMYKLIWYGQGLVGQHEKKTNKHDGHQDLQEVVKELNATKDREQWEVIRKNFDVEEVVNYFAVNMLLSHWDGFFNNYFAYHDAHGTGKWTMYPWDQDKAWGIIDSDSGVFYKLPVTFGMNGDRNPGAFFMARQADFGGWWRPPGWFSGPLLANPYFRRIFLTRVKDLTENVYVEAKVFPLIDAMHEKMKEEVRYRANLRGENQNGAEKNLENYLNRLKEHLQKRRQYLLAQREIQEAGRAAKE